MLATTALLDLANMIRDSCWKFVSTWRVNSVELHGFNMDKLVLKIRSYEGGKQSGTTVVFVWAFHRIQCT